MIIYDKLSCILRERNMQWKDLCDSGISVNMPAKFSHNRTMNTENIDRVCEYLEVQPSDIMEWISTDEYEKRKEEIVSEKEKELQKQIDALQQQLKELRG